MNLVSFNFSEFFELSIAGIQFVMGLMGILVIVFGLIRSVFELFRRIFWRKFKLLDVVRLEMGQYLMLGLEFFIAKDIIQSAFNPSADELVSLAMIVFIRAVLGFMLSREMAQIEKHKSQLV